MIPDVCIWTGGDNKRLNETRQSFKVIRSREDPWNPSKLFGQFFLYQVNEYIGFLQ